MELNEGEKMVSEVVAIVSEEEEGWRHATWTWTFTWTLQY